VRLLFDMNFGPAWPERMRALGIEALHWTSVGGATASDTAILRLARARGLVVVTQDLGVAAILAATGDLGPSVIQVRRAVALDAALARRLAHVVHEHDDALRRGAVLSFDAQSGRSRIRGLPSALREGPATRRRRRR